MIAEGPIELRSSVRLIRGSCCLSGLGLSRMSMFASCLTDSNLEPGHAPQYAVLTRRSSAFAIVGEGGESLTMTTIWRFASLLEYAIVL